MPHTQLSKKQCNFSFLGVMNSSIVGDFTFTDWTQPNIYDVLAAYENGPSWDLLSRWHLHAVLYAVCCGNGFRGSVPLWAVIGQVDCVIGADLSRLRPDLVLRLLFQHACIQALPLEITHPVLHGSLLYLRSQLSLYVLSFLETCVMTGAHGQNIRSVLYIHIL